MADATVAGKIRIVFSAILLCRRNVIGMLVMAEVNRRLDFFQRAIRRGRREGELHWHEQKKKYGDETTHARHYDRYHSGFEPNLW